MSAEFHSPVWAVEPTFEPRPDAEDSRYCVKLDPREMVPSQLEQLRGPLLLGSADTPPQVTMDAAIASTHFIERRGWKKAGLDPADVPLRQFVAKTIKAALDEAAGVRAVKGHRKRTLQSKVAAKMAVRLQDDVEWLERAVVDQYIAKHHPARHMPAPRPKHMAARSGTAG